MVKAKKFIYSKPFNGLPKISDFQLEEEILPELQNGGSYSCLFFSFFLISFVCCCLITILFQMF